MPPRRQAQLLPPDARALSGIFGCDVRSEWLELVRFLAWRMVGRAHPTAGHRAVFGNAVNAEIRPAQPPSDKRHGPAADERIEHDAAGGRTSENAGLHERLWKNR